MSILVTGAAGFIGSHVSQALLALGERVVGIDCINAYYDPALKRARLSRLETDRGFSFHRIDLADRTAMAELARAEPGITNVVHLAAQAGVRYSLENPVAYVEANIQGLVVLLEAARHWQDLRHVVYASSSSVYGANRKVPFSVEDPVDKPLSLYAASKRSGELIAETYARLYGIPLTGLRFFTVYGPWGRPDMAYFSFAKAIFEGSEICLHNRGQMRRDFTWIDDILSGVLAVLERPPQDAEAPHRLYNLGNNRAEPLDRFLTVLEAACGRKAITRGVDMQPGEVLETFADIDASRRDFGFEPVTTLDEGLPRFVAWFRAYHGI